jgi:hypothetical protein
MRGGDRRPDPNVDVDVLARARDAFGEQERVLDERGVDRLLERLREVHSAAARPDIAPELLKPRRRAA